MSKVPGKGSKNAKLMVVGMAPEKNEVMLGEPFVGPTGKILTDALLQNGLRRDQVWLTNISDEFLAAGQSLFTLDSIKLSSHMARLQDEIYEIKPNCILALGDEPTSLLTKKKGITKWAGSILPSTFIPGQKVVASVHPAWIVRGMWKWLTIFSQTFVRRAVEESIFSGPPSYPVRNSIIGPSFNQVIEYIEKGHKLYELSPRASYMSFDIETMYWRKDSPGQIACVGIGYNSEEAICIPFTLGNGRSYWSLKEEAYIWEALAKLLQSPIRKVAQNAAFEWIYFWLHGIYPSNLFIDTMLLHHCLYPDFGGVADEHRKRDIDDPGHGLKFLTTQYTRSPYYKDDGRNWSTKQGSIENLWLYNTQDVMVTAEVSEKMYIEAQKRGLWNYYENNYNKVFLHTLRMEWDGILIDIEQRQKALEMSKVKIEQLQEYIDKAMGKAFNVNATKQVQDYLYNVKKYPVQVNKKTRRPTADKEVLAKYATRFNDELLLNIMSLKHEMDFKADVLEQKLDENNRIHTHFKLGGTDGARWSSTKSILGTGTNLQNVPRDGIARSLFLPE